MQDNLDSRHSEQIETNDYLSLLQIKFDCETVYGLVKALQQDGITGFVWCYSLLHINGGCCTGNDLFK